MARKMERGGWPGYFGNVEVVDGEGRHPLVKFRSPLVLPAP